jgi:hypothetical protein
MRIFRGNDLVGILVAPGEVLISDDPTLIEVVKRLPAEVPLQLQRVINHLNYNGFLVRGAYQGGEGATPREKETKVFHDGARHEVHLRINVVEASRFIPSAPSAQEAKITENAAVKGGPKWKFGSR